MMVRSLAISSFFSLIFVQALEACPSYGEARSLYFESQDSEAAIKALECRVSANDEDYDSMIFLSDLLWWEGYESRSREIAEKLVEAGVGGHANSLGLRLQNRIDRFRLRAGYTEVQTARRSAYEVEGAASVRYWKKNELNYRFLRDARLFDDGPDFADHAHRFGHIAVIGQHTYADLGFTYANDPEFLPDYRFEAEPHYVWNGHDFSVGFVFSDYEATDVYAIKPTWLYTVNNRLQIGARTVFTFKPEQTLSFQLNTTIYWLPRLRNRWIFSGGKADEGEALISSFFLAYTGIGYNIFVDLIASLDLSLYRGDVRDENRVGGNLEYSF